MSQQSADVGSDKNGGTSDGMYYTCRRCRRLLFYKCDVMHESARTSEGVSCAATTGVSEPKAHWRGRKACDSASMDGMVCTSVFTHEMPEWMQDGSSHNQGGIKCPGCGGRVGSFAWSGVTCSCGRWITPAFQFQLAKIDRMGGACVVVVGGGGGVQQGNDV